MLRGGGRFVVVLLLTAALEAGGELFFPDDATADFFTWADDLKPGYVIVEKNMNGRLCYCKKPLDLLFPNDLLTTTTTPATTPDASSFTFSFGDLEGGSFGDADLKESSFEYVIAQSGLGFQRRVNVSAEDAANLLIMR